ESSFIDEDLVMEEMQKKPEMLAVWEQMLDDDRLMRIIVSCCCVAALIYFVVMAYSGVMLQNLESVRWSWAASIMAMICLVGLPLGVWGYLSNEEENSLLAFGVLLLGIVTAAAFPFGL